MKLKFATICFQHAVLFSIFTLGLCNLTCLSCDDVALPSLCTTIDKCGPHEVCGLEQSVTAIGSIRYRQRCIDRQSCLHGKRELARRAGRLQRSSSSVICTICCEGHLCNSGGCGMKAFEDDFSGHLCYSCDTQIGHNMCNTIKQCGRDQVCHIEPLNIPGAPTNLFRSNCSHPQSCATPSIVGKKRSGCSQCCTGSLCNDFDPTVTCNLPTTSSTTLPTATSMVTATATVTDTTVQTTTKRSTTSQTTPTTKGSHSAIGDCHDVMATCQDTFCHEPIYHEWALANCRKSCGLCGGINSGTSGTSGTVGPTSGSNTMTTTPTSTGSGGVTSGGSHTDLECVDKADGCLADVHCGGKYAAWGHKNCQKTCKICIAHTSAVELGGVYFMLKGVAGVQRPDIYELWKESRTLNSHVLDAVDNTNTFNGHFKPDFSNYWLQRKIDKVTVSMYEKGVEKAFITFNATGSDKLSWFHADRIINSSWTGHLAANSHMSFEMQSNAATGFEFNAGEGHTTSCDSRGWMTIVTDSICIRDPSLSHPAFIYCPNMQGCSWKDGQYASAEVFAIHAHSTDLPVNSEDPDETAPGGAVSSGSALFTS